jgi:hypothetical protein
MTTPENSYLNKYLILVGNLERLETVRHPSRARISNIQNKRREILKLLNTATREITKKMTPTQSAQFRALYFNNNPRSTTSNVIKQARGVMELANAQRLYGEIIDRRKKEIVNKIALVRRAKTKNQKNILARNAKTAINNAERLQMFNTSTYSRQLENALTTLPKSRTPSPPVSRTPTPAQRNSHWQNSLTVEQRARLAEATNPRSRAYVHPLPSNRNRSSFLTNTRLSSRNFT